MSGSGNSRVVLDALMASCAGVSPKSTSSSSRYGAVVALLAISMAMISASVMPRRRYRSMTATNAASVGSSSLYIGDSARNGCFMNTVALIHGRLCGTTSAISTGLNAREPRITKSDTSMGVNRGTMRAASERMRGAMLSSPAASSGLFSDTTATSMSCDTPIR